MKRFKGLIFAILLAFPTVSVGAELIPPELVEVDPIASSTLQSYTTTERVTDAKFADYTSDSRLTESAFGAYTSGLFDNLSTPGTLKAAGEVTLSSYSGLAGADFLTLDGAGNLSVAAAGGEGGKILQSTYKHYTASVSGSGGIVRDDTPVLSGETVLLMDGTITPTTAGNKIFIEAVGSINTDDMSTITFVAGLFINNTALKVQENAANSGRYSRPIPVFTMISTTSTDPITYQYRAGTIGAITLYMNSLWGTGTYANTIQSYIRAWEETP
jgi:hypothetical protein